MDIPVAAQLSDMPVEGRRYGTFFQPVPLSGH
jgi:hypothetical protein